MKFTKATDYALHAIALLAQREGTGNQNLAALAQKFAVSPTYLSKILTQLVKGNLVRSTPGVSGGYSLQRQPENISLLEVIEAVEGHATLFECAVHQDEACSINQAMLQAESVLKTFLRERTIRDLMNRGH